MSDTDDMDDSQITVVHELDENDRRRLKRRNINKYYKKSKFNEDPEFHSRYTQWRAHEHTYILHYCHEMLKHDLQAMKISMQYKFLHETSGLSETEIEKMKDEAFLGWLDVGIANATLYNKDTFLPALEDLVGNMMATHISNYCNLHPDANNEVMGYYPITDNYVGFRRSPFWTQEKQTEVDQNLLKLKTWMQVSFCSLWRAVISKWTHQKWKEMGFETQDHMKYYFGLDEYIFYRDEIELAEDGFKDPIPNFGGGAFKSKRRSTDMSISVPPSVHKRYHHDPRATAAFLAIAQSYKNKEGRPRQIDDDRFFVLNSDAAKRYLVDPSVPAPVLSTALKGSRRWLISENVNW